MPQLLRCLLCALCAWLWVPAHADAPDGLPTLRIGSQVAGTLTWALDSIEHHQLDTANGLRLQVQTLASPTAATLALQASAVDIVLTDWLWVAELRRAGADFQFVPATSAVGVLYVRPDSGIATLADLKGRQIGVAGGPTDKNWRLLQRAATAQGLDLLTAAQPSYAAPPALNELMLRGKLPAVLNFWHYGARLQAAGMTPLLRIDQVLAQLGVDGPVPLLGWVFSQRWADRNPETLQRFLSTWDAAAARLLADDAEWQRLRPLMQAEDEATFVALRDGFRDGLRGAAATVDAAAQAGRVAELIGEPPLPAASFRPLPISPESAAR